MFFSWRIWNISVKNVTFRVVDTSNQTLPVSLQLRTESVSEALVTSEEPQPGKQLSTSSNSTKRLPPHVQQPQFREAACKSLVLTASLVAVSLVRMMTNESVHAG